MSDRNLHHSVIVGGGPAGMTCALYLARFLRRVLVIDAGRPRAGLIPTTWNFPGHPEGVSGPELLAGLREHAARNGAEFCTGEVVSGERAEEVWRLELADGRELRARNVVLATGVEDVPPDIPNAEKYSGRGLRYCAVCDGYEARGCRVAMLGRGAEVARHALFFTTFTEQITVLLNGDRRADIPAELLADLERRKIPVLEPKVTEVLDEGDEIRGFRLEDGTVVEVDRAYGALPVRPRSDLARKLGARIDERGFVHVDAACGSSVPGLYAVGDVANCDFSQIVIGMGQAAVAAIQIHSQEAPG